MRRCVRSIARTGQRRRRGEQRIGRLRDAALHIADGQRRGIDGIFDQILGATNLAQAQFIHRNSFQALAHNSLIYS